MSIEKHVQAALTKKNIFVTNINGTGEDVMVFTNLDVATISAAWKSSGKVTFDEIYEVPDDDVQFYIYEPCWLSPKEEERAKRLADV